MIYEFLYDPLLILPGVDSQGEVTADTSARSGARPTEVAEHLASSAESRFPASLSECRLLTSPPPTTHHMTEPASAAQLYSPYYMVITLH